MHDVRDPTTHNRTDHTSAVSRLLQHASELDLSDPCWQQVIIDTRQATLGLARAGVLEPDLVVEPSDPPVVVARLLARIHQRLQAKGLDVEPPVGQAAPAPATVDARCCHSPDNKERE